MGLKIVWPLIEMLPFVNGVQKNQISASAAT